MTELCSTSRASSYIFGNFSGWWLGEADNRKDQPHVSISRWDEDLKASGFMGVDATVFDDEEPYRQCAVIVSKKEKITKITKRSKVTILSANPEEEVARSLTDSFLRRDWEVTICQLGDELPKDQDIISCLDLETNFFENVTEKTFTAFQVLLCSIGTNKLLWLTKPTQIKCRDPRSAQSLGVTRTIRSELALQFYTLEINTNESQFDSLVAKIFDKIIIQEDRDNLESDKEFVVDNGAICVGRYHPFSLVEEVRMKSNDRHNRTIKSLEIEKPGMLESLTWKTKPIPETIPKTYVEVEVRTVGVNFRDISIVTGLMSSGSGSSQDTLGMEVAGTVQRVGAEVNGLMVGDRVMAFTIDGGFSTHVVLAEHHIIRVPDGMSFEDAATIQATFGTAVYALLEVGRLGKDRKSVLIHSTCGGVGLAALQVCQMMGAEIFATVGNEQKKEYLVNNHGIPRHHIFSSRNSSFYEGVMRETAGVGVDLVLNSLSGELLHESWRCVAQNGALLELGKRDLVGAGRLDMRHFLDNRSYCGVDMLYLVAERPLIVRE
jgi:NADPH:quinone reductase-like Zn-dependent oxidoreductase